jgi:undecaprenyl-diphosphatase
MTANLRFCVATIILVLLSVVVYDGVSNVGDQLLLSDIVKTQTPQSLQFWRYVTWIGAPLPVTGAAVVCALVLCVRRRVDDAKFLTIALVAATALDRPLKLLVHRPRPLADIAGVMPTSFSFPSGHVLFATVFYGGLTVVLLRLRVVPSAVVWTLAGCLILLVVASRLCLGVHYPTDVMGGLVSGFVCLTLTMWIVKFPAQAAR